MAVAVASLMLATPDIEAWNRIGHGSIAQIARNHMSRKALRNAGYRLAALSESIFG